MLGKGPLAQAEDVALRIRCGTCNVTINVGHDLVVMLAHEGFFKCPACNTRQAVNQAALHEHLRLREMEQNQYQHHLHHPSLSQVNGVSNPVGGTNGVAGAAAPFGQPNAHLGGSSRNAPQPPSPPPPRSMPPSSSAVNSRHTGELHAGSFAPDLRVEGSGKRKLHPDMSNPDPVFPKRMNCGLDSGRAYVIPSQSAAPNPQDSDGDEDDEDVAREGGERFQDYKPAKLRFGVAHSDSVVESSSLAAAEPPDIDYELHIDDCVKSGSLSSLQLEAICYACQRHETHLPEGERSGFFIGDGAGVGKGRTIAGLILENWRCGRRRHLWVSVSSDLKHDARRDLDDVGADFISVHALNKMPYAPLDSPRLGAHDGVIFLTYATLISSTEKGTKQTRLKQLLEWCGPKFDGLIVFDECHKAKNLVSDNSTSSTKTGQYVQQIQEELPEARVVYCSATGATELRNMAYMVRLGLWGKSLAGFKNFNQFKDTVGGWGVGALELVAMELKARGMYLCRTLSFQGTEFRVHNIELTPDMQKMYHRACHLWRQLLSQFQYALENLTDEERKHNGRVWPQFWSAHQRFFRQLCIAIKVDETVKCAEQALSEGKCVVIGLQSTGEMRLAELVKEKGSEMDDFASGLKETMIHLIENHWPLPLPTEGVNIRVGEEEELPNGLTADDMEVIRAGRTLASPCKRTRKPLTRSARRRAWNSSNGKHNASSHVETIDLFSSSSDNDGVNSIHNGRAAVNATNEKKGTPTTTSNRRMTRSQSRLGTFSAHRGRKSRRNDEDDASRCDGWESDTGIAEECGSGGEGPSRRPQEDYLNSGEESSSDSDESLSVILLNGGGEDEEDDDEEDDDEVCTTKAERSLHANGTATAAPPPHPSGSTSQEGQDGNCLEDRYSRAMHFKREVLKIINKTTLPSNPLDLLVDQLGGPDKVAEMTGRKGRFIRVDDEGRGVRWEARNASGVDGASLEATNVAEAKMFMDGQKLVAIISEAASAGISLHADRRHNNQRRRVHLTLELPWSADRAVQQFGRSHRSNQANGPQYRLMMTPLGGEARFAAAVAKRLQNLGALTQGDRNAGPELGSFNYDNSYGRKSLQSLYSILMEQNFPTVMPSSRIVDKYPSFSAFCMDMRKHMLGVGMITPNVNAITVRNIVDGAEPAVKGAGTIPQNHQFDIPRFLNRLLGIQPEQQKILFGYYLDILKDNIKTAKKDGRYDNGIRDIAAKRIEIVGTPEVISTQEWGGKTLHYKVSIDRGVDYPSAHKKLVESMESGGHEANGFYQTKRAGPGGMMYCILALKSSPGDTYQIVRPSTGIGIKKLPLDELRDKYVPFDSETACIQMWEDAYADAKISNVRIRHLDILAGEVLPIWDATSKAMTRLSVRQQRQLRIVRLQSTVDNRRLVGIHVPDEAIPHIKLELAAKKHREQAAGEEDFGAPMDESEDVGGSRGGVGNPNDYGHVIYSMFNHAAEGMVNSNARSQPGQMNGQFPSSQHM